MAVSSPSTPSNAKVTTNARPHSTSRSYSRARTRSRASNNTNAAAGVHHTSTSRTRKLLEKHLHWLARQAEKVSKEGLAIISFINFICIVLNMIRLCFIIWIIAFGRVIFSWRIWILRALCKGDSQPTLLHYPPSSISRINFSKKRSRT